MRKALLTLVLLLVICFSLVAWLQPRYDARAGNSDVPNDNSLADLLGDGRKMVADYFYTEADVYFHSGYYPSVFDQARKQEESDSDVSHPEEGTAQEEQGFMGKPLDWIDAFSRHFHPARHTHLAGETVREMLPWMKLSAELDPHRVQTYIVTAYWLRARLKKSADAEDFLRAGLKANPHSPDLLYALGEIYLTDRKDLPHAKNLFLAALRYWHQIEEPKPLKTETGEGSRNTLLLEQILGGLVSEEIAAGHLDQALQYMEQLKANASDPAGVQQQIDKLQSKIKADAGKTNAPTQ
jgi:tetratricopeptide (TPR) repeat protein